MIAFLARHPTAGNLLMVACLLLGLFSVGGLKREAFPDHTSQTLMISASYNGATAEEIEEAIAMPIEEALSQISNIKTIQTTAMEGAVSIRVEMADGADWQTFYNDIKTKVEAISSFPGEFENLLFQQWNHTDQVVSVAVSGEIALKDLKAYCEQLKKKFSAAASGVLVDISGFGQREFRIELRPEALLAYKLSVSDVAAIIRSQNRDLPSGTLETGAQDIKLRFNDRRKTVEALEEIKIRSAATGSELRLGDIAAITARFVDDNNKTLLNGENCAVVSVSKSKSADSLTIYNKIMKVLEAERAAMKDTGLTFTVTRDMASEIQDRLDMVYVNALQGVVLVFAALWLFLNFKLSFWVTMGLPVSFLGGLCLMHLFGISLNMISTFALLIATGLLMDDAIVIAENIACHVRAGEAPFDAAVRGCQEVARGVFSSFATTICVFAPLMSLDGGIGKILRIIPVTLIIVLSVSLLEAFFVLPNHLAHSFDHSLHRGHNRATPALRAMASVHCGAFFRFLCLFVPARVPALCLLAGQRLRARIDGVIERIRLDFVGKLVGRLMHYRYYVLATTVGLFIVSISLFPAGRLKFVVFPQPDGDTVCCRVQLAPGTPIAESERLARQLCDAATRANAKLKPLQPLGPDGQPQDLITAVTVNLSSNSGVQDSGPHLFTVYADLLKGDKRKSTVADVINAWRAEAPEIPGALSVKYADMMEGPGGKAIEIRLRGDDLKELKLAAAELRGKLAEYAGVSDIADNLTPGKPEVVMSLRPGALKLGLTADNIASQLRAAYQGNKADELQIGAENYEFNVRLLDELAKNQQHFDTFKLITASGKTVPLSSVATLRQERGLSTINRYNRERTVTVSADVNNAVANAQEITSELMRSYLPGLCQRHPGVGYGFGGQREAGSETGSSMLKAFIIGVLGIFIILSLQFRSWLIPLVVMFAIPLAVIGSIWGHYLWGMAFNMQSLIGVISLAGIVVNDSILMMEFIRMHEGKDLAPELCAENAAADRFRAVALTSLTTIAGLLPLLMEKSLQAQMLIPMALSIVCGLTASTVLVLFVIPSLYLIVQDVRRFCDLAHD